MRSFQKVECFRKEGWGQALVIDSTAELVVEGLFQLTAQVT